MKRTLPTSYDRSDREAIHLPHGKQYTGVSIGDSAYAHLGDLVFTHDPEERARQKQRRCHRAFKTTNYEGHKDVNPKRAPNTCKWVSEHRQYQDWQQSTHDDLLWISADPGCGKSVLSRYLIDSYLVEMCPESNVCYFFFKDNDEQSNLATALCAMLHQLFEYQPGLIKRYALPWWEIMEDGIQYETKRMWEIIMSATRDTACPPIICVLDALDECRDADRRQLINFLCEFHSQAIASTGKTAKLKFLVTSRPYDNVERWFADATVMFPEIRLRGEDENEVIRKEIDLVIRAKVSQLANEFCLSANSSAKLQNELLRMEHRTYLWLHLATEHIREAFLNSMDPDNVDIDLLPSSVEEAYDKILSRVVPSQKTMVRKILMIIVGARRPLQIEEMAIALAITTTDLEPLHSTNPLTTRLESLHIDHLKKRLREWCGLFVFIDAADRLGLIHQTAKEFLLADSRSYQDGSSAWKSSFTIKDCEAEMARLTTVYLYLDRFGGEYEHYEWRLLPRPSLTPEVHESEAFFEYSAQHWASHYQSQHVESNQDLLRPAISLCKRQSLTSWFDWRLRQAGSLSARKGGVKCSHIAAYTGVVAILQGLVDDNEFQLEARDDSSHTPLTWAVAEGHEEAIAWLIQKGANVDAECQDGTPLCIAAKNGHDTVVRLLLHAQADFTKPDRFGYAPFHIAAGLGHLTLLHTLLDHGVNVNSKADKSADTALIIAARRGHADVVRALLAEAASSDITNHWEETALDVALDFDRVETVNILLMQEGRPITETAALQGLRQMRRWEKAGVSESAIKRLRIHLEQKGVLQPSAEVTGSTLVADTLTGSLLQLHPKDVTNDDGDNDMSLSDCLDV